MAMEMSCSQSGIKIGMAPEQCRPIMSAALFSVAMKGDKDVLIQCLGLLEERSEVKEIETEDQTVQSELQSATRFGDTVLHLLITEGHNKLALMVFQRESSLLRVHNKMSETPMHCAARRGNVDVILCLVQLAPNVVRNALEETNNNGDTALHVAAKHGQEGVCCQLMILDPEMAYKVNKEGLSPFYIAMVEGYTTMIKAILQIDPTLGCTRFSDGMYPIHVAARAGNVELVKHFMSDQHLAGFAQFLDHRGRNLFHIAVEENNVKIFTEVFPAKKTGSLSSEMAKRMIDAKDYEGNTLLHIAAIKGHVPAMRAICRELTTCNQLTVKNNQDLTPFDLSVNQVQKNASDQDLQAKIESYVKNNGRHFTQEWFDNIMQKYKNKWERMQVIGLGSVLITTVTFAAAFTIPGGYNQDNGKPILGRKYMFKAFVLANTQSFIQAFSSLFTLVSSALLDPNAVDLQYATHTFIAAAGCMVVAFGLGSYVMLAPVSKPIAFVVLVFSLQLGSPFMYTAVQADKFLFRKLLNIFHVLKLLLRLIYKRISIEKLLVSLWLGKYIAATDIENNFERFFVGFSLSQLLVFPVMIGSYLFIFLFALF